MKIAIYGMGYVGCVSAACLAQDGHDVVGVDIDPTKVGLINDGKSPIVEPGLDELVATGVTKGKLSASTENPAEADLSIVCVGTPSRDNGSLDLQYLERVMKRIGTWMKATEDYHVVNVRSTVLPGTVEGEVIPILEASSGKKAGTGFGVCMNPEFMRESTSIDDFYNPPFSLIGELDERSGDRVAEIYQSVDAPLFRSPIREAEIVKYACNAFHAVKVTFANEIGMICKEAGIDSHHVMRFFCEDDKLNLSSYYLKPGFAFGGSCLPKDVRALLYKAQEMDLQPPLLSSLLPSNRLQVERAVERVLKTGKKNIGFLGFSFKAGTDDLRESPIVEMIERLLGKGLTISIHDKEVALARLVGSNKRYIEQAIPHISSLMRDSIDEVVASSDVIVIGNKSDEYKDVPRTVPSGKIVLDLVRIMEEVDSLPDGYDGLCW